MLLIALAIRVPQPARFAVHKLIVAQKRPASSLAKRRKDLVQAEALFSALTEGLRGRAPRRARGRHKAGPGRLEAAVERSLAEIERGHRP